MRAKADLASRIHDWLDRAHPGSTALALGYSGGGDSHALLCIAAGWARQRGVILHALTVDHGLRRESRTEAEQAVRAAGRLGAQASLLNWPGDKPVTGIQAAARQARHVLLAEACRTRGIGHLLLAHTLDDQAETVWMRLQAGGGWRACAAMAGRSHSPVWPQGRGVEILRPLLDVRRGELRAFLQTEGESWIEDSSNLDRHYTRIRTRQRLGALEQAGLQPARLTGWAREIGEIDRSERRTAAREGQGSIRFHPWGGAELNVERLARARPVVRRRLIEAVVIALSGHAAVPRRSALDGLVGRLLDHQSGTAAGVHTMVWRGGSWMFRDAGGVLGRVDRPGAQSVHLPPESPQVWDGRYEIETPLVNIIAEPLGRGYNGVADRDDLEPIPGPARSGLLVMRREGEVLAIAGVRSHPQLRVKPLMEERYRSRLLCEPLVQQGGTQLAQP